MNNIILTEKSNPATTDIDLMDSYQIAKTINDEDQKIALAIKQELPNIAKAIDLIVDSFNQGGRMGYFGAGTSGRLGVLDASEMLPTFSTDDKIFGFIAGGDHALRNPAEGAEDSTELGLQDLQSFNPQTKDVVVIISASGNPDYVVSVLQNAKKLGCKTIAITSNPDAKTKAYADIFICPPIGPEPITGSSRMKSGTSQKMILNMLSTGAMIRIGKTYKNYMVDVRLSNEKLIDRGIRIVSEIAKIPLEEAAKYIKLSDNNVKIAIVMVQKNCSKAEAEALLTSTGGILRKVK